MAQVHLVCLGTDQTLRYNTLVKRTVRTSVYAAADYPLGSAKALIQWRRLELTSFGNLYPLDSRTNSDVPTVDLTVHMDCLIRACVRPMAKGPRLVTTHYMNHRDYSGKGCKRSQQNRTAPNQSDYLWPV